MSEKKSSRILTFDLLRGYFLVAIIIDHLAFFPNILDLWSGRGALYVSAAEGFFIISGIVLGIVRGSKLIEKPFKLVVRLLLKRSVQLYITSVVLMLMFTFIGWMFLDNVGLKAGIRPPSENIWEIIKGALTYKYIYGWADYLRLYAIFILVSPLAMWLLRKKLWYVVMVISIAIWSQFTFLIGETSPELGQLWSWQLIFFSGLVLGFHWNNVTTWWRKLSLPIRRWTKISVVSLGLSTMAINYFFIVYGDSLGPAFSFLVDIDKMLRPYFSKDALPWPRLALVGLWFSTGFWLFSRFEKPITDRMGWLLLPFGTNSLYVYTMHAVFVFFIHLVISTATSSIILNLILSVATVLGIWLCVRYKILMKIIPR